MADSLVGGSSSLALGVGSGRCFGMGCVFLCTRKQKSSQSRCPWAESNETSGGSDGDSPGGSGAVDSAVG